MASQVAELLVYPVKSLGGYTVQESVVEPLGLQYDRRWALVDADNEVLTAREFPSLLALQTELLESGIEVSDPAGRSLIIPRPAAGQCAGAGPDSLAADETLRIFSSTVTGYEVDPQLNTFFSDYLGEHCRLMAISYRNPRAVQARHGGEPGDRLAFADDCALLLTNAASLQELNRMSGLATPMRQFRPNIVVSGSAAYTEQNWSQLQINSVDFHVAQGCRRCVLATVDPQTCEFHPTEEPLRTLTETRLRIDGGVVFGIHLSPRGLGQGGGDIIRVGDDVMTRIG